MEENQVERPTMKMLPGDEVRQIMWRFAERYDIQMAVAGARQTARSVVAQLVGNETAGAMYAAETAEKMPLEAMVKYRVDPSHILHFKRGRHILRLHMERRRAGLSHLICHTFGGDLQGKGEIAMRHIAPLQCATDGLLLRLSVLETMPLDETIEKRQMVFRHHKTVVIGRAGSQYLHFVAAIS